jgi:hypothetical protein
MKAAQAPGDSGHDCVRQVAKKWNLKAPWMMRVFYAGPL